MKEKTFWKEIYMCNMRGREREKLGFKCLNSDRDGEIYEKTGIQTKREGERDTDR
jgi:hypothetical protein